MLIEKLQRHSPSLVAPPSIQIVETIKQKFFEQNRVQGSVFYGNLYFLNKTTLPSNDFSLQKPQKLISYYTQLLLSSESEKQLSKYFHLRGCVYFDIGEIQSCLNDFLESLKYNKKDIWLYYDLSDVYHSLGNFKSLFECCGECIKLNPTFPHSNLFTIEPIVYQNLSIYFVEQKNYEEALKYLKICQELNPNDADCIYSEGVIYFNYLEDLEESYRCFDRVITLSETNFINKPTIAMSYYHRSLISNKKLKFNSMLNDLESSLSIDPDRYCSWNLKGYFYFTKKQYQESILCFSKGLDKTPNSLVNCKIYNFRGRSYMSLGQYKEALYDFFE
jgi:lipoprotein NlpI